MTFEEILDTIASSEANDWWTDACWGANSGPSYHYQPEFWDLIDGAKNVFKMNSHSNVAAYKPNLSITIAWGLRQSENFKEEWANKFPDSSASSSFFDVFYNGALVFREVYVTVDGGRARLPLPKRVWGKNDKLVGLTVPERYGRIIALIDSLDKVSTFDDYFGRAGMKIVEDQWP